MSGVFKLAFGIVILGVLVWWFLSENKAEENRLFDLALPGENKIEETSGNNPIMDARENNPVKKEQSVPRAQNNLMQDRNNPADRNQNVDKSTFSQPDRSGEFKDLTPSEFVEQREKELQETISNYDRILNNRRR